MKYEASTNLAQNLSGHDTGSSFRNSGSIVRLALFMSIFVVVGCTNTRGLYTDSDPPVTDSPITDQPEFRDDPPAKPTNSKNANVIKAFVGLSEHDAEQLAAEQAREFRVGARDGKGLAVIANLVDGRITVVVVGGVVTDAEVEEIRFR